MREIRFRGKGIEPDALNQWVYGDLIHCDSTQYGKQFFIKEIALDDETKEWLVNYNTVGQYTGLKDATKWEQLSEHEQSEWLSKGNTKENWAGKEIYEGDIVKFEDIESESVDVGLGSNCMCKVAETELYNWAVVVEKNGCFGLDIKGSELYENRFIDFNELIESWNEDFFKESEIIGNIYDNPEFLGG